jgi:hypothetical protein
MSSDEVLVLVDFVKDARDPGALGETDTFGEELERLDVARSFRSALSVRIAAGFLGVLGESPRRAANAAALAPLLGRSDEGALSVGFGSAVALRTIEEMSYEVT